MTQAITIHNLERNRCGMQDQLVLCTHWRCTVVHRRLARRWMIGVGLLLFAGFVPTSANAQMFGVPRQTGRPIQSRSTAAQAPEQVGTLQGNERFMRENRSTRDFVGSSRQEGDGFVGSVQSLGTGRVVAATETLQPPPDQSRRLNQPIPPLAAGAMYYPRLVLELERALPAPEQIVSQAEVRLEKLLPESAQNVSIQVIERRAIVQGEVADEAERKRIEILLSFEPGIDTIDNRLEIRGVTAPVESAGDR